MPEAKERTAHLCHACIVAHPTVSVKHFLPAPGRIARAGVRHGFAAVLWPVGAPCGAAGHACAPFRHLFAENVQNNLQNAERYATMHLSYWVMRAVARVLLCAGRAFLPDSAKSALEVRYGTHR